MGFSRQEYWSELPFPSPGNLSNPGIKPGSPALQADALLSEPQGKPLLERVAISFSRGSPETRDQNQISCISCIGRQILYLWATREALAVETFISYLDQILQGISSMKRRLCFLSSMETWRKLIPAGFQFLWLYKTIMEKEMATHSGTLAWKIPWIEGPGGLQSMGLWRVRHNWVTSLSLFTFMHWRRKWQPTPVFLPGEPQGQGSLVGCSLWGHTESDMTQVT